MYAWVKQDNQLYTFWILGKNVCTQCCSDNFISGARLLSTYGIALDSPIGGKRLIDHIAGKVFMVYFHRTYGIRDLWSRLTLHPSDFKNYNTSAPLLFLWLPHLAQILDLSGLRKFADQKKRIYNEKLVPYFKAFAVKRLVVAAQNESIKKQFPSAFITMQNINKNQFFMTLSRGLLVLLCNKKNKQQRSGWKKDFVYVDCDDTMIELVELSERLTLLDDKVI